MIWTDTRYDRWDPWAQMLRLQHEVDRVFGRYGARTREAGEFPGVNIWTGEKDAILTAEIPGVDPKAVEVTVEADTVTIRGRRQAEEAKEGEQFLRRERGVGSFVRAYSLPFPVDAERVTAQYQKGILQVILPRAEADRPRRIAVTAN
ncbi:MAG: Spore protein SP21 [Lentisphaerae bacterium ADurb.BinA184]|nr:MAG: Spore protein SP21 [Lentisphaerae bacterium ADurb.BinA184]